jgi:hypothetical protein
MLTEINVPPVIEMHVREVLVTAVSATGPSIGTLLAQLISDDSGGSATPATTSSAASTSSDASSTTASSGGDKPAAYFTLSDQAKANLHAADRLQAYADALRGNSTLNGGEASASDGLKSLLDAITQPTGSDPAASSSASALAGLQIPTVTDSNESDAPKPLQTFTPTQSLSKSVTYDGYTLTLNTDAGTQWYGIALSGNGIQAYDKHFGSSAQASGASGITPGVEVSTQIVDNNEALDAITVTRSGATASSASVSSSSGGSASASAVSAEASSITFLVNYATGQIAVAKASTAVSAQSTERSAPGSTLSTIA